MQLFPPNNFWNTPIDTLPLLVNNTPMMAEVNATPQHLHLDDVMPINIVSGGPMFTIPDGSGGDSDPGLYLIPPGAVYENGPNITDGNDHHMLVVDLAGGILYETYQLNMGPPIAGYIQCKWDLGSNAQRTGGSDPGDLASCDASGMAIAPGVLQYADILAGIVTHALRCSMKVTYSGQYVWPATHFTRSSLSTGNSPMFGMRLRLQAGFDVSGFSPVNQIILNGMKRFGLNVSDNGIYGACEHDQDSRWDATDLLNLHNVPLTAFEFVDTSGLMVNAASAMTPPVVPSVMMTDKLGRSNSVPIASVAQLLRGGTGVGPAAPYQMTRTPNGPVLVFRNGNLLQAAEYSLVYAPGKTMPTITPLVWSPGDTMSAVITRAVPLSFTIPPQIINYWGYALWREDWTL